MMQIQQRLRRSCKRSMDGVRLYVSVQYPCTTPELASQQISTITVCTHLKSYRQLGL